jgi:predicted MPP superfamily phosphohydrolase
MSETRGKGTIRFVPEEVYTLDLDTTEKVFQKQLATLNEHKDSLTADEAARVRALEFELERMEEIRQLKKEFQPEDIQIVLTHEPLTEEYVRSLMSWSEKEMVYSIRYASLILAGHYNGGQWRLPWKGAIYVPEFGWFPEDKQIMGLSYLGDIPQYISPGLGSDPHYKNMPGRIYNPPVITKITLTRKSGV